MSRRKKTDDGGMTPVEKRSLRNYDAATRGILWSESGGRCQKHGCDRLLVEAATPLDPHAMVGQVAHIIASSADGPRGDASMPPADRDLPDNLILLCPTCHVVVDRQPDTYPASCLRRWKEDRRRAVATGLAKIGGIGIREQIARIVRNLIRHVRVTCSSFDAQGAVEYLDPVPIQTKIEYNDLRPASVVIIRRAAEYSKDVERLLRDEEEVNPGAIEHIKGYLVGQYHAIALEKGDGGSDAWFLGMVELVSRGYGEELFTESAEALVVHLFVQCDILKVPPS